MGWWGSLAPSRSPLWAVSVGIERVFAVLEGKFRARAEQSSAGIRETRTQVSLLCGQHCKNARVKAWQAEWKPTTAAQVFCKTRLQAFWLSSWR